MSAPILDVQAVARLARLSLTEEEITTFGEQLGRILDHIELLNRVDISDVEPTAHASPVFNVVREDVPVAGLERSAVLDLAPRTANQLVILPKVLE
ncbi:MAG: Asp-tRNA(Asn)/Glu-tRNA(Gln) amidotransferase subunit GatC [Terrimicrobiaceae bacterium]